MSKNIKIRSMTRAKKLLAGTSKKYVNGKQVLSFGGGDHTIDEVTAKLQRIVDLREAAEEAKAIARGKVADERAELPALLAFMSDYVAFIKATLGNTVNALAVFGLPARKEPSVPTVEVRIAAVEKRKATRTARGTRGPVAKLA